MPLSYLEISKDNLVHNYNQFRRFLHPQTKIMCVVKANAYGHGIAQVVPVLEEKTDAEYFALDDIEELRELRKHSQKQTLVLGYVSSDNLEELIALNGEPVIYDIERASRLNELAKKNNKIVKIHMKIDASLGRQGVLPENAEQFAEKISRLSNLDPVSVYAHFANIEDIGDPSEGTSEFSHAQKQINEFTAVVKNIMKTKFPDIKTHISSTAGSIVYEKNLHHDDYIRLGIGLYGLWPSKNIQKVMEPQGLILQPVMRWISHSAQIKELPANASIGYGLTYKTYRPTTIAVIPQGYSDGYDRGLSNKGEVLIHSTRCPLLGRVMMNMIVVDTTELKSVLPEDEVILLGNQGDQIITAEEIAGKIDTINYEIVSRVSPLVTRVCV